MAGSHSALCELTKGAWLPPIATRPPPLLTHSHLGSAPGLTSPHTCLPATPFLRPQTGGAATASCPHPVGGASGPAAPPGSHWSSCRAPSRLPPSSKGSEGVRAARVAPLSHRGQETPWVSFVSICSASHVAPLVCFSRLTWARGHFLVVLSSSRRSAFTPNGHLGEGRPRRESWGACWELP